MKEGGQKLGRKGRRGTYGLEEGWLCGTVLSLGSSARGCGGSVVAGCDAFEGFEVGAG